MLEKLGLVSVQSSFAPSSFHTQTKPFSFRVMNGTASANPMVLDGVRRSHQLSFLDPARSRALHIAAPCVLMHHKELQMRTSGPGRVWFVAPHTSPYAMRYEAVNICLMRLGYPTRSKSTKPYDNEGAANLRLPVADVLVSWTGRVSAQRSHSFAAHTARCVARLLRNFRRTTPTRDRLCNGRPASDCFNISYSRLTEN